jgi:hypothetical protein
MELQMRENDSTYYNLDGGIESRFPLTIVTEPCFNKRPNGSSKFSPGDRQDTEGKLGSHDFTVE